MNDSKPQDHEDTTIAAYEDAEASTTPFSARRSLPRVIDSNGVSRDPGGEAVNVLHQLSATHPVEAASFSSNFEGSVHIASPERHFKRRLSNSLSTGFGTINTGEAGRSWSRAGLLQPYSYLTGGSQSRSRPHTFTVESGAQSSSAPISGGSGPAVGSSLSTSPAPQTKAGFSSRTPVDIRASTVELSMLATPVSRAHPDYLGAAEPSSFSPHRRPWSPPTSITEENESNVLSTVTAPLFGPQHLRTPLTTADLTRLATARCSSVSPAGTQRTHVRDQEHQEHTFVSLPQQTQSQESRHIPPLSVSSSFLTPETSLSDSGATHPVPRGEETSTVGSSPDVVVVPSTPSGLSLLLAQQRREPSPQPESQNYLGTITRFTTVPEGAPQSGSDSLRRSEATSGAQSRMSVDEETPLLLPSSPSLSESSRGPSLYYGVRSRSISPPRQRSGWWSWGRRRDTQEPTEVHSSAIGNGHSLPAGSGSSSSYKKKYGKAKRMGTMLASGVRCIMSKDAAAEIGKTALRSIPAVLLGVLLNILDGVSYGMIMFPASGVFQNFGGIGVSMFFVTTIVSQIVYSFGGSGFPGANGSMMIEVVPFFHILAQEITRELGEGNVTQVVSTTMAAYTLSSVLTGLTFFLLGYLRLGVIIGFFPRHILVGCIGGIGVFLIQTGLAVCARIDDDDFSYSLETLKFFFGSGHTMALWMPAFGLAVLLRVITHRFKQQLVFPIYFMIIPAIFYFVAAAARLDVPTLRRTGWVFDMAGSSEAWYKFYTFFSWKNTSLRTLWLTMPTQFALLFFNILHPPLNVPALAVSLNEDVDTNKELVAHGYSNLFAGLLGTVPNYLVYVNTLLFYRVGGTTRVAGFILALATFLLLIVGTAPIGYIPIMLVGALIFVLGIDLVKEALWDTRNRTNRSEYLTIVSIMVCMTLWDFVIGVLFGIVVCCFFFVAQNSRRRSIRAMFTGDSAMSAVRRPSAHRDYIRQVAKQTIVLRLQGFLFFGTIAKVEEAIRDLVEPAAWQNNPIRFLVIDFTLVAGIDLSSAEAFVRVQRVLGARDITMVLCGVSDSSSMGHALRSVGLLEEEGVELFEKFSDAMEWTENAYLRAWFMCQKKGVADIASKPIVLPGAQRNPAFSMAESFQNSPRRNQIHTVAGQTLEADRYLEPTITPENSALESAYIALSKAFSSYDQLDVDQFIPLLSYFERVIAVEGTVLWEQNDPPDGLYLIESGVLRAIYSFPDRKDAFEESMVGGTLAGELSALSDLPRNARVVVEKDVVLWRLSMEKLDKLEREHPELSRVFFHLVLKVAKTDYDILLSALAARQ